MKKFLAIIMLLALTMTMLFSCGPKPNPDPDTDKKVGNFEVPEVGYDGSEVTITFYHTMGSNLTDVLDPYIAEFNKL